MRGYEEQGSVFTHERTHWHFVLDGARSNALGAGRYRALRSAAAELRSGDVLLITAHGRHFSAGQDLDELRDALAAGTAAEVVRRGTDAVLALLETRATVVVAVNGAAVGGGALLAAAADVVLMAEDARIRVPELELGMPLGASVLSRLVGGPASRRLMLTGAWASAQDVERYGAIELVAPEALHERAEEVCRVLSRQEPGVRAVARTLFGDGERAATARLYRAEVEATLPFIG